MRISEEKAEKELVRRENKAAELLEDPEKAKELVNKATKKLKRAKNANVLASVPRMLDMIKSYLSGEYRGVPIATIIAIIAAVLYFVSPIDGLPDFIPFLGYVDDAGVLALCLTLFQYDLASFEDWKNGQEQKELVDSD